MKTIEDYFTYVRQLMQRVPDTSAERYEEQRLSVHRGNLRIRLRFSNHALLEISEAIVIVAEEGYPPKPGHFVPQSLNART